MDEKEPVKKRTRTRSAPRTGKKAPSAAPAKATPRVPVDVPSDVSAKAPSVAPAKATPRVPIEVPSDVTTKAPTAAPAKAPSRVAVDAPSDDQYFWVNHGPILRNLHQLCDALASDISDEQFAHHVTAERNDFADWVGNVFKDAECAEALRRAHTRVGAARALKKYLETA